MISKKTNTMERWVYTLASREGGTSVNKSDIDLFDDCVDDTEEWSYTRRAILTIWAVTLVITGSFGNTVTYMVLREHNYKNNVIATFLRYLAMLDLFALYTVVLEILVRSTTGIEVTRTSTPMCILYVFLARTFSSLDHWMLVLVTATRIIYMKWPLGAPNLCTMFNYHLILALVHVFIFACYGGIMISTALHLSPDEYGAPRSCYWKMTRSGVTSGFHVVVYVSINFVGPSVLLVVLNIILARQIKEHDRVRRRLYMHAVLLNIFGDEMDNNTHNALCYDKDVHDDGKYSENVCDCSHDFLNTSQTQPYNDYTIHIKMLSYKSHEKNHTLSEYSQISSNMGDINISNNAIGSILIQDPHNKSTYSYTPSLGQSVSYQSLPTSVQGQPKSSRSWPSISQAQTTTHGVNTNVGDEKDHYDVSQQPMKFRSTFFVDREVLKKTESASRRDNHVRSLTLILMTSTTVFLITNVPFWVFHFFMYRHLPRSYGCQRRGLILEGLYLLRYTNHSLNFIFYCAVGIRFRRDFILLLRKLLRLLRR